MLTIIKGNILDDDADALVNPVNCVGVMGKGLALEFKKRFPDNFKCYKELCNRGIIKIGSIESFYTENVRTSQMKWIVNFPTKEHWRNPSRAEWIISGLNALATMMRRDNHLKSIAFPMLGCGLGRLDQYYVKTLIADFASMLPDVDVRLYE